MGRQLRVTPGGCIFHVLNRANGFSTLFDGGDDFDEFVRLLGRCLEIDDMRILAWCLMPNHWHLLLWPRRDRDLSRFVHRLTIRHTKHRHIRDDTTGRGHLYQGRFKTSAVQDDGHLLTVCRYIERNPVRARMVTRATDWRWSSARGRSFALVDAREPLHLEPIPADCPTDWERWLCEPDQVSELERIRRAVSCGVPLGTNAWVAHASRTFGFPSEIPKRGRPFKKANPTGDSSVGTSLTTRTLRVRGSKCT
jgi:putative transposase